MGKSYKAWSKELGTVYIEEDSGVDNRGNENKSNYLNHLLRLLGPVDSDSDYKGQTHIKQKELILQKMTEDEKADYEKNIRVFEEKAHTLENELEDIERKHKKNIKTAKVFLRIPVVLTILYALYLLSLFVKKPDIGGIIFIVVTSAILYRVLRWVFGRINSLFSRPLYRKIDKIKRELDETNHKKEVLIYNYTTEFTSPWVKK